MHYIVIDLEFNGRRHYDISPMEVIEIGAVKLNESLEPVATFQSYIRPRFPVNDFALNFCGIEKQQLEQSDSFEEVIDRFHHFCSSEQEYVLLAFGGSDFFHLYVDCKINGLDDAWLIRSLDIGKSFKVGLQQALKENGLEPVGQQHSALDDALNAVQLVKMKPELARSKRYFYPNRFKICTGGIKKWITLCLEQAIDNGAVLTWEDFRQDPKTQAYMDYMQLTPKEIGMVENLFYKFFSMKYGRKAKKLLPIR